MTVANLYCSRGDVNRWIPAGAIAYSGRLVDSSNATTNVLMLDGHGFETDDQVTVRATAEGGTLSAPLVEGTTYYVIRLNDATFKLSATASGAAIDLTTAGVSMIVTKQPPYDDIIEFYSRWADAFLPAHLVPLESPIHPTVKGIVAELSAKKIMNLDGKASAIVDAAELASKAMLERFAKGIPLRGAAATASANLAVTATLSETTDARGWGSESLP